MNTKLATAQIRVKNWTAIIQDRNQKSCLCRKPQPLIQRK